MGIAGQLLGGNPVSKEKVLVYSYILISETNRSEELQKFVAGKTKSVNLILFFDDWRYFISIYPKSKDQINIIIFGSYAFLENQMADLWFGTDYALISLKILRRR